MGSGCARILNYVYAWLNHVHTYSMDAYTSFSIDPKNYIFRDSSNKDITCEIKQAC